MTDEDRDGEQGKPDQPAPPVPGGVRPSGLSRLRRHRRVPAPGAEQAPGPGADPGPADGPDTHESADRYGRVRAFFGVVTERLVSAAPRIPVRDLRTLRKQFPGLGPEEIADRLVAGAAKSSGTVGAGVGAAAMMPVPPAMPAELAAEIVGVATVELKLIAELHEVYGCRAPGNAKQRAAAYLGSWTSERGIDIVRPMTLNAALNGRLKQEIRQQLQKRTMRNLPNIAPFMIGSLVGAVVNQRDTKKIARKIRADLRVKGTPWDQLPVPDSERSLPDSGGCGRGKSLPPSGS